MPDNPFKKTIIKIDGMTCQHCIDRISSAFDDIDGIIIKKVKIGKVVASVHKDILNREIRNIIHSIGYEATEIKR